MPIYAAILKNGYENLSFYVLEIAQDIYFYYLR